MEPCTTQFPVLLRSFKIPHCSQHSGCSIIKSSSYVSKFGGLGAFCCLAWDVERLFLLKMDEERDRRDLGMICLYARMCLCMPCYTGNTTVFMARNMWIQKHTAVFGFISFSFNKSHAKGYWSRVTNPRLATNRQVNGRGAYQKYYDITRHDPEMISLFKSDSVLYGLAIQFWVRAREPPNIKLLLDHTGSDIMASVLSPIPIHFPLPHNWVAGEKTLLPHID